MIANFDFYNRFEQPVISLCSPDDKFLGFVDNIKNLTISPEFNAVSEMTCDVYKYSDNNVELKIYDDIKVKRQFFLEDIGFFIITEVTENDGTEGVYKSVTLYSCEHELSYKKLTYFKTAKETYGTYKFWDKDNPSETLMGQILSSLPRWSIDHVDEDIAGLYRTFDEPDTTIYSFLMGDVEDSYGCLFDFDIKNRVINVYNKNNYIRKTTILLSRQDVINNIKVDTKSEEIYTAFTLYGDDEITYSGINPLGGATVYNFDYYKPWMSEGLKEALENWEAKISKAEGSGEDSIGALRKTLSEQYATRQRIQSEIDSINENIVLLEKQLGVDVLDKAMVDNLTLKINSQKAELDKQNDAYTEIDKKISGTEDELKDIQNECSLENNFTTEQLKELDAYIYEGSDVDDTFAFTENMSYDEQEKILEDLYSKAKSMLKDISLPTEELSLDTNNFIFQKDFAPYTEQLNTGVIIDIELSDDIVVSYILLKMEVNYEDKTISLTFGNKYRTSSSEKLWSDWQASVSKSSATLSYERSKYGRAVNSGSLDKMNAFMKSSLNLTLNQIKASDGQSFELTDSGLKGRRILSNEEIDPQQLWITSNGIVFTDNAWDTIKTAIGRLILPNGKIGYGINTEFLLGKMIVGQGLNITNQNGTFTIDENGVNMRIGTRNLIQYADVIAYGGAVMDKSNFLTSGEIIIIKEDSAINGGFYFDRASYYTPNTEYVLSGFITVLDGTVENFRILNGKGIGEFISFTVDGTNYGNPFGSNFTEINEALNDKKNHYFVLKFKMGDTILPDTGYQYTYFQPNAGVATYVKYKLSGFQMEQGNTVSDWSPAPEDTQMQIDGLILQNPIDNLIPFPYDTASGTYYGLSVTMQDDGGITVTGTPTQVVSIAIQHRNREDSTVMRLEKGKTYTLSGTTPDDYSQRGIRIFVSNMDNNKVLLRTDTATGATFTADADYDKCGIFIHFAAGQTYNNTIYPIINYGSVAQPYRPYQESQTFYRSEITQTKDKIDLLVADGSSSSEVEITPQGITAITNQLEVTGDMIVEGAITADKIDADAVTADKIAAKTITSNEIASETITSAEIATGAITADKIEAGAITADKITFKSGGRNLLQCKNIVPWAECVLNTSNFIKSGTIIAEESSKEGTTAGGFRFDAAEYYKPNTNYILSGYITVLDGTVTNFRILNNKGFVNLNLKIDGTSYFSSEAAWTWIVPSNVPPVLNDKKKHYFTFSFRTQGTIPADENIAYTYIQPNCNDNVYVKWEVSEFKLEEGDVASAWSPAPEDISVDNVYVPGTTEIDGNHIKTNTITANKIATGSITANQMTIGDYTNYITVDANTPATMLPTSFYGGTTISEITNSPSYNSVVKPNASNPYLMFCGYTPFAFEVGDELYIDAVIPNFSASDFTGRITIWFYGANGGTSLVSLSTETLTFKARIWNEIKTKIVITSDIMSYNPKKFAIGIPCGNYNLGIKAGSSIRRKIKGSLIVDGSITADKIKAGAITADKIDTDDLFAQDITATGTITGLKLKATTIEVGANSTIGGFTVWGDSINNGTALTNTKVGNSTGMGTQGGNWAFWAGNGRFSVQQNGAVYCSNLTAEGGKIGGVTIDGENGLKSGDVIITPAGGIGVKNIDIKNVGICDVYILRAGFVFFPSNEDEPIHTVPWEKIYNLS